MTILKKLGTSLVGIFTKVAKSVGTSLHNHFYLSAEDRDTLIAGGCNPNPLNNTDPTDKEIAAAQRRCDARRMKGPGSK